MKWMQKKIHPTWQFTVISAGVVIGVALAAVWPGFSSIAWLFLSGLFAALVFMWPRRYMLIIALVAGGMLGLWRGSLDQHDARVYRALENQHVILQGSVAQDVDRDTRGRTIMNLKSITINSRQLSGQLWVALRAGDAKIERGDKVEIDGRLSEGFGNYVGVIDEGRVASIEKRADADVILQTRNQFAAAVKQVIDEPSASLGIGYLLGQKSALPADLMLALQVTGLTHVVVASGYNLTILVRLARRLFEKISKYLATVSSVGMVLVFVGVTGMSPSMTRAGLVSLLAMWAWYYGRRFHPVTLLLFAGAVTVLVNPSYVWGDVGWMLSFSAFAGVMIVAPLLQAYFYGPKKPGVLRQILGETFSAQLMTAPIILLVFGQFSNVAIVSNLLILPFVPLAMLLTFAAGLGSLLWRPLGEVLSVPAQWLLDAMVEVVHWTASVPWAQSEGSLAWWGVLLWYAVVAAACWYMKRRTNYKLQESSVVE